MALAVGLVLVVSGCSAEAQRGFMPGYPDGAVTNHTDRITNLWVGSWTAALFVGLVTWGLMLWSVVVYRKRKDDHTLPVQTRYHVPIEMMYTVIPILMVGVLFFYTARDTSEVRSLEGEPDVTIHVIAKQWSWDFNYVDSDVYETGEHAKDVSLLGGPDTRLGDARGTDEALPTLVLPAGQEVRLILDSRDVIHSFWVPAFLDKMDVVPGHTNRMQLVPQRIGYYAGKCAELCGEHHSGMLFNLAIVSPEDYELEMEALAAKGQTGQLGMDLNREQAAANIEKGDS